jgi:hypothetical protein
MANDSIQICIREEMDERKSKEEKGRLALLLLFKTRYCIIS